MVESLGRSRGERLVRTLGFCLLALLIAAPDYWTYRVLSSHSLLAGVSILIVSYVAYACALWLLCVATSGLSLYALVKPVSPQPPGSVRQDPPDGLGRNVDHDCDRLRYPGTRHRGCNGPARRRRQASA